MTAGGTFLDRLRNAGVTPADSETLRLQKSLMFFATGLICFASIVWLMIYWQLGPRFSSNLPFALQLMLVGNLLVYLKTLDFNVFRLIQLSLFLFTPFVAQWSIGSFITASGISLWALLAPIGAVLFIGPPESLADMALAMCRLLNDDFSINEMHLELRIGIGTGPVVAGVVGKKKFIYDLWGDTVNIASRVTTEGVPGVVQVDQRTYQRLRNGFDFQEPLTIYLKGKGNMVVHRLIGRRAETTGSG
ncbi:MAG: hypothetical protein IPJ27_20215 [Candidatus Accumulibacter sp.]|uniref:adenylate cyclase n=2 Tax=Candidatus Accumulibacter TaxID=327159 RepID=A0A935Q2U5_9PROT|nr:hypothetical protein [Candidatus Accumulibacter proximus]